MLITSIFLSSRRHQSLDVIITISLCRNYSAFRLNLSVVTPPPHTHTQTPSGAEKRDRSGAKLIPVSYLIGLQDGVNSQDQAA